MINDKETRDSAVHFRQVTERFCSHIGDNVVIMQTVQGDNETFKCMNANTCPGCTNCKNNI